VSRGIFSLQKTLKIDWCNRPATENDVKGIRKIYNCYIELPNSMVTEVQTPVSEDDVRKLIAHCKDEKYPIIVAVRGRMPTVTNSKGQKVPLPQFETIVGFAFAKTYGAGLSGIRTGRSRGSAELQVFVHPEHTRKSVGRSLLDRLIQCLSHSYG
jgi:L-amino acid N-acyltransferase YncA